MSLSPFAKHVKTGLKAKQAFLSSRFIYDEKGSKIFQQIMELEDYYLTNAEFEILKTFSDEFRTIFSTKGTSEFDLIEFGAGDGLKTKLLLNNFLAHKTKFSYRPVDISNDILEELSASLKKEYPKLSLAPLHASYTDALSSIDINSKRKNVVLFLGSNIGNFTYKDAYAFVEQISNRLKSKDLFVLGVDLQKNPKTILKAYNDDLGVTASFNLNLLTRINKELGGDFDLKHWDFFPLYNPESGEVRSYLFPTKAQTVSVDALGVKRHFKTGEVIHTEISRKYNHSELENFGVAHGLHLVKILHDSKELFANAIYEKR